MRKYSNGDSYSARLWAARNKAVQHCADFFEKSGVNYDCLKTVQDTVKPELNRLATLPEFAPYNVNSRMNLQRVGDEVHRRWNEAVQKCVDCGVTVFASSDNHTGRCTGCERKFND